jgi:hypothetical protein
MLLASWVLWRDPASVFHKGYNQTIPVDFTWLITLVLSVRIPSYVARDIFPFGS